MDIWNEAEFKIPPFITLPVNDGKFAEEIRSILYKRTACNTNLRNELANSAALLSRLMARRKNSFSNMKGFQCVCKLNTALSRLLKVDVEQVLDHFLNSLPDVFGNIRACYEVPSRPCFDYVLLRIISVYKIYQRICFCCTQSADYFHKLLANNFFLETITLFLAVIAKIWDLGSKLGNTYCDLYRKLIKLRKHLPKTKMTNDLDSFQFPMQLQRFIISGMAVVDNSNDSGEVAVQVQKDAQKVLPSTFGLSKTQKSNDIGMAISRESLKPVVDLSRIHNIDDVRQYFKEEDEKRQKSLNCATRYILKHEWLGIQRLVERKIIANDHKKALTIFRKFITNKI